MCKIFGDDTPFISKVLDVNKTVIELNATWKRSTNGFINGKCNLSLISIYN